MRVVVPETAGDEHPLVPFDSRLVGAVTREVGIEVVHGEVERIDPGAREAVVSGETLRGDHLLVALGASFALDAIPGLAEAGLTFCTLEGASPVRQRRTSA